MLDVGQDSGRLELKRADVSAVAAGRFRYGRIVESAVECSSALVGGRGREVGARVNSRAASGERVGERWATVVLERAKHRIGSELVAGRRQKPTAIVAAEVVTVRGDRATRTV